MATTFTNTATLSYNGGTVQSNVAVGAVEGVLSVDKNTAAQAYRVGDTLAYVVSIVNNSENDVTGVIVTDDLGAYAFETETLRPLTYVDNSVQYYSDGVLQSAPAVSTADGLVFSDITIPENGNALLIYQVQVNEFAPLGGDAVINNTVTLSGAGVCGAAAEESVPAETAAVLAVLKTVTPVPVAENGELTYTFRLENSGSTAITADDNAVVTDTFLPILSGIRVTLDGAALTAGTDYTYDETTGVFSTADGVITIPAATFAQDPATGVWSTTPGVVTLTVTGNVDSVCDLIEP